MAGIFGEKFRIKLFLFGKINPADFGMKGVPATKSHEFGSSDF
jgi:hypothetical protein